MESNCYPLPANCIADFPLSIIIPSHSRVDCLRACLITVRQYAPAETEVIVVDDGSTESRISRAAAAFSRVKIVRLSRRGGFCRAANLGIAVARHPIIELLNDDTEVTPGWAETALAWFRNPEIVAVAPLVLQSPSMPHCLADRRNRQPIRIDSAGDEYDYGGIARKRYHGHVYSPGEIQPGPVWGVSATAGFYRRDAVIHAGGFPESFEAYFEDVDLSFRLRQAGGKIWHEPNSLVWHRVSASYGRRPGRRLLMQQSCNEERVFWRNLQGSTRRRFLMRHCAVLVGKAIRRFEEGQLTPWLFGRIQAILRSWQEPRPNMSSP